MPVILPRRVAAMTALTVAAASGVALVGATAASAGVKTHTTLSIREGRAVINPGGGDTISGQLRARHGRAADRRVALYARPSGATAWAKTAEHRTGRHGNIGFEVSPATSTRYRLVFAGNKGQQASHSGVVGVRVEKGLKVTSLSITTGASSIAPGASTTVNGVLADADTATPLAGATVYLLQASGSNTLHKVQTGTTGTDGSVNFSVTPPRTRRYALSFKATATQRSARSAKAVVHVRQASSLKIGARTATKKQLEIITGTLRGSGHALLNRKVTLQERASSTVAWSTVGSKKTAKHGNVQFSTPLLAGEQYELVFAGGGAFDGCQSGAVTVS